jgi:alkanesulfonate monooxygenase SsuD/methylene tetrahydromethanopterin reductase-like flavin-dependent oxidoreductase (luciferase family)
VTPIYQRTVGDFAQSAAFIDEISDGRFRLGIGVSHEPAHQRMGVTPGPPLADIRHFLARFRTEQASGPLPPVIVATLRRKMVALAGEIADGLVFANGSLSHMAASLAALPSARRADPDFFIGNMIPTCIADDMAIARAVHRRSLTHYAMLPNYRNYWREAGYDEDMTTIEKAIAQNRPDDIPKAMSDRWLDDCTLSGPAHHVRGKIEAWRDAGIKTPILVPSSATGNQMAALSEVMAAFQN